MCNTPTFTVCLLQNLLFIAILYFYTGNTPKICLHEMKHSELIWEPECQQMKLSMNIIYLPKGGVVCELYLQSAT